VSRRRLVVLAVVAGPVVALAAYHLWPVPLPADGQPLLIAHRGVHQDFSEEDLDATTCTAERIFPPAHDYLENTLPSMAAAFAAGADVVELDVHPTTDGQLAVFHDWAVDCRTEGSGETRTHTMAALRALDIGHGYTADGGRTFPFRGTGVGAMPSLEEVLAAHPGDRLVIDLKDGGTPATLALLEQTLAALPPDRRARVSLWASAEAAATLRRAVPEVQVLLPVRRDIRTCGQAWLLRLGLGAFPEPCREVGLLLQDEWLPWIPGWPRRFLANAAAAGAPVYVWSDDPATAGDLAHLPLAGILTDRIEQVAPAVRG
jgi:glycerophosphoryl diester phosphodiesterase